MRTQSSQRSGGILIVLASCMALQMAGVTLFLPLFALRFNSFGAGVAALSASDMAYALTFAFAAPLVGMLADRFGRRPAILLSFAGQALIFIGYLVASATWSLIALRGLAGVFAAGLLPIMTSIVGDLAPENRRGRWIGIVNGGAAAGFVVGPLLGGLLYDRFGLAAPAAVAVAMAVGALLLAALRIPETHKPTAHPAHTRLAWRRGWQALPARSTLVLIMIITFGVMFAYAFVQPPLMFYAYDDLLWTPAQLGLVMSVYGVAFMAGAFALGQSSDRLGRKPVLVLGLALFSAQFIGLILFHDMAWIGLSFIVAGLGNALYDPALSAIILDVTPSEHIAGMVGLKGTAGSLGSLLGPALVVLLTPFVSLQAVFVIAAGMVAVLTLVSAVALRLPEKAAPPGAPYSVQT